jgi:hypothetical protein
MFDTRFNNGYQNTVMPLNTDPYADQYLNQMPQKSYGQDPYAQGNVLPNMMSSNIPYPVPPSQSVAPANAPSRNTIAYADGGSVKKQKGRVENSPYPMLAEMIRKQGKGEDTILAHINPLEAMILKDMGGSGTINKKTGLPQFGLFSNPKKWFKSVVGPAAGVVLGNMILPGVGGMIGGALGGATGSKIRGRKDAGQSALRGLGMGAIAPTLAGLAGSGLSSLGASGMGGTLSEYGSKNAILPSLGKLFGVGSGEGSVSTMSQNPLASRMLESNLGNQKGLEYAGSSMPQGEMSFTDKLLGNTKDYLTQPGNLLTLASTAGSLMNRPKEKKEKTPEQQAAEEKRLAAARILNPTERARYEADLLAEAQMRRKIARQKFLPDEALGTIEPLYRRSNTPEEYAKENKWLNYYNNPEFSGKAMLYKEGGNVHPKMMYEAEEMEYPSGLGRYIAGDTNGQDDKIPALLSDGEYVVRADDVANLGDGNNAAGAKKLDIGFEKLRKHKGGSIKLPPKAKSLASYIK